MIEFKIDAKIEVHYHCHGERKQDEISPADQKLLDALLRRQKRIAEKLSALDTKTPPAQ